ncbi:MAG: hypothetical protein R3E66_19910 [bacterium]
MRAIIQSMTKRGGRTPGADAPALTCRIAHGSGSRLEKVEQVLQQFNIVQAMMQQFSNFGGGF